MMYAFNNPSLPTNPAATVNFGAMSLGWVSLISSGTGRWIVVAAN
jgi:hypothetical protein